MKEKMIQTGKSSGKVLLFALALLLAAALVSFIVGLVTGQAFVAILWRICSALGGIGLLLSAVLLLTGEKKLRQKTQLWTAHFPGLSFLGAVLTVAVVLLLCAGVANRLALSF
jgi:hypothetical protein